MKEKISKKTISHLREDIGGYKKSIKKTHNEIKEDKKLIKKIKEKSNGKKKNSCCEKCEEFHKKSTGLSKRKNKKKKL